MPLLCWFGSEQIEPFTDALRHAEFSYSIPGLPLKRDGCLHEFDDFESRVDPQEITDAVGILVAQLLGLLVAFVGEKLTLRIVRQALAALAFRHRLGGSSGNEKVN
jgi:hypothetical protein